MYHISHDKRSKLSVQLISESLNKLLEQKNLDEITIKALCDNAGVGRVTFYRHFDSVHDVLQKQCDDRFDQLHQYLKVYYHNHSSHEPFLKPFLRFWYQDSQILEILIRYNKQDVIREAFMRMIQSFEKSRTQRDSVEYRMDSYHQTVRSAVAIAVLSQWIENGKNILPDILTQSILTTMKEPVELSFED
ncbi:MAG: TetR/AcrR family transcriptional regulator [Erysipelotrichaceae bacterium]|nr:TetR/AcrR family transcriptional regulator [Erysipelotrichaceae bacterium]